MSKRSKRKRRQEKRGARSRAMKSPSAVKKMGLAAFHRREYGQAIKLWRRVKLDAEPAVRLALAEACFRQALADGLHPGSRAGLQRAIELTPNDGRLWYYLGLTHHGADEIDEARAAYARAAQLGYAGRGIGFARALAHLEQDPRTDLGELSWLSESDRGALAPIAGLLRDDRQAIGAHAKAKDGLLARFMDGGAGDCPAVFWRGLALFASRQFEAAYKTLASAAERRLRPGAEAVQAFYAGLAATAIGKAAVAQQVWAQAAGKQLLTSRMTSDIASTQMHLVHEHLAAEEWRLALAAAEAALAAAPDDRALLGAELIAANRLAGAAASAGAWEEALRLWEDMRDALRSTSAKFGPLLPVVHNIAIACEALERWEAAAEAWTAAMKSLPRRGKEAEASPRLRAWMRRRVLENFKRAGQPDRAIYHYRQVVKSNPDDLEMRMELADALLANEQEGAARNELERILGREPRHVEARMRLAEVYALQGEPYMVEQELRHVLEIDPNHSGARQAYLERVQERGQRMLAMGWSDSAREALESALEFAPHEPLLIAELGRVDLVEENVAAARARFEAALASDKAEVFTRVFGCWASAGDDIEEARRVLARAESAGHSAPDFYIDAALECFRAESARGQDAFAGSPAVPHRGRNKKEQSPDRWEPLGHDLLQRALAASADESGAPPQAVLQQIVSEFGVLRPDVALLYARQLAERASDDPRLLASLGLLEALNEQTREANDTLRKAARLARKQGQDGLAAEIDDLRQQINHPLFSLFRRLPGLAEILGGRGDDDFDFDDDDFFDGQYYRK